jgi:hypothetical protein
VDGLRGFGAHSTFNDDDGSESDCNDPAIYTYTWGEASTKNGMALSAAVIGFSCAGRGILYIAVVRSIRSCGGATRTGMAIDGTGGPDVSITKRRWRCFAIREVEACGRRYGQGLG